jgi:ferric enterobactin receptor
MRKIALLLSLFMLPACGLFSQNLPDILLDQLYNGPLDEILDNIGTEYKVKFEFDREKLHPIHTTSRPFAKPLDRWLTSICPEHKLKWYQKPDGTVHIIGRYDNVEAESLRRREPAGERVHTRGDITVRGTVFDRGSGEALPFVSVRVAGENIGTSANVDGYFTLLHVPSDTSTLIFNYLGYHPAMVFLRPDAALENLVIELDPSGHELSEVVVTAEREDILQANAKISMLKMSTEKLSTLPSLGEKDVFRAFQLMPGVSAANEQTAGLYVRGGTPDQTLTVFDGFTVYNVDHLFGFYSAFNANSIKDVQLYKSAFDAKYGGRLSSVVEITGKDGNTRSFNAGAEIGMLSASLWMEQPFSEKLTTIIAVRRSWRGPIYNKIFNQFQNDDDDPAQPVGGPRPGGNNPFAGTSVASWFYDFNAKTTWKPNARDVFSLSFYSGKDELDNSQSPSLPGRFGGGSALQFTDFTDWGNTGASAKWSARWNKKLYSNTLLSYSTYFSNRDRTTAGSIILPDNDSTVTIRRGTLEHNRLQDFSVRNDWEWKITDHQQIEFGASATYNDIVYTFSQNDTASILDQHNTGITLTGYLQDKITLFDEKLSITPGLRYSWFSPTAKVYAEPRLNASYNLSRRIKLKAAAGHYNQFAKRVIREDIFSGSRDFWVLADNDRLPVSSSEQYVGGASWENDDWLVDVEAYYKPLHNLSEYSLRVNPRPTAPGSSGSIDYEENFFDGEGVARGVDVLLQKKFGRWNGWIGYTLGDVRHHFSAYSENDFYAAHDVTHEFKLINLYKWRNWDFSATWIYASGKPYTAPEGAYTITLLDGTTSDFLNVSEKNANRLPAYHRLDLAATVHFNFLGSAPASLNFSIFNLYGRKNVWYKQFEVVDNQLIESDVNYLGFTPNLTFSVKLR